MCIGLPLKKTKLIVCRARFNDTLQVYIPDNFVAMLLPGGLYCRARLLRGTQGVALGMKLVVALMLTDKTHQCKQTDEATPAVSFRIPGFHLGLQGQIDHQKRHVPKTFIPGHLPRHAKDLSTKSTTGRPKLQDKFK